MTQAYDPNPFSGAQEGAGGANTEAPSGGGGGGGGTPAPSTGKPPSTPATPSTPAASSVPWGKVLLGLAGAVAAYFVGVKFLGGKR